LHFSHMGLTDARTFIAPRNRERIEQRGSAREPRRRLSADRKE
jgi:hypothetical protein